MEVSQKLITNMFVILHNNSGKLLRLLQKESSKFLREGKCKGGKFLSLWQRFALKLSSLFSFPTELSIVTKLQQSSNENLSKFRRSETSGIWVKY